MKDPVFTIDGGRVVTTSRAIADGCGVTHDAVLQMVQRHRRRINNIEAPAKLAIREIKTTGRPYEEAVLDERQAAFLISLMQNSVIVMQFKEKLVLELFSHRDALAKLGVEIAGQSPALSWALNADEADQPSDQ